MGWARRQGLETRPYFWTSTLRHRRSGLLHRRPTILGVGGPDWLTRWMCGDSRALSCAFSATAPQPPPPPRVPEPGLLFYYESSSVVQYCSSAVSVVPALPVGLGMPSLTASDQVAVASRGSGSSTPFSPPTRGDLGSRFGDATAYVSSDLLEAQFDLCEIE